MKAWKLLNPKSLFTALECVLSASILSGKRKQYYCHPYSFKDCHTDRWCVFYFGLAYHIN